MSFILLGILNSQAAAGGAKGFELIETTELTSSANTISFTNIDQSYAHLQLRLSVFNTSSANAEFHMTINNDTGANYAHHQLVTDGSGPFAAAFTSQNNIGSIGASTNLANSPGVSIVDILDYSNTSKNTTIRLQDGYIASSDTGVLGFRSGLYMNTNAVNTITFDFDNASYDFNTGTIVSLYGIGG